jgi:hypothetical protein
MGLCDELIASWLSVMVINLTFSCFPICLYSFTSGLPYWLREIDRIIFRANNDAYKVGAYEEYFFSKASADEEYWTYGTRISHAERNGKIREIHSAEVEGC